MRRPATIAAVRSATLGAAALVAVVPAPGWGHQRRHPPRDCILGPCTIPWAWDDNELPAPEAPPYPQGFVLTVQVPPVGSGPASGRLNRYAAVADALGRCWDPSAEVGGRHWGAVTLRLSFKRDGSVNGVPRVTYVDRLADRSVDADLRRSLTAALDRCTPLPFSPSLGNAIAGQIFSIRFIQRGLPI